MHYCIDRDDRIVDVSADWDSFALANGATPATLRAAVLGRPLNQFVQGDAARMFVRSALLAARESGQVRVLPYRCDSPTECRRFDMCILPSEDGSLRVEHLLLAHKPRARTRAVPLRVIQGGWRCSQCLSVRMLGQNEWLPPELVDTHLLADDVCDTCAARLFPLAQAQENASTGWAGQSRA